jgi:hypothetical protein
MTIKKIDANIELEIGDHDVNVEFIFDPENERLLIKSESISLSEAAVISAYLRDCADALDDDIGEETGFGAMH